MVEPHMPLTTPVHSALAPQLAGPPTRLPRPGAGRTSSSGPSAMAAAAACSRGNLQLLLATREELLQLAEVQGLLDGAPGPGNGCLRSSMALSQHADRLDCPCAPPANAAAAAAAAATAPLRPQLPPLPASSLRPACCVAWSYGSSMLEHTTCCR